MEELGKLDIIPLDEILSARRCAPPQILNTPLIKLHADVPNKEIYLKLENLQPVGSFKIRGAFNALVNLDGSNEHGVYTSSAGNFAQGLAWGAKDKKIPCNVIVPDTAPQVKLEAIKQLHGNVIQTSYDEWWKVMTNSKYDGLHGVFVHPCCDRKVMAGNGVIGLEILDAMPEVDTIICSYGGGGHSLGIASAMKQRKPNTKVYACEVETATPLSTSLKVGRPIVLEKFQKSFVDGMNGKSMFPCMWDLASNLLTGSIITSLRQICDALKLLVVNNHIIAEGAGAATVAAALSDEIPGGKIVCVISGGNIDIQKLNVILNGGIPE